MEKKFGKFSNLDSVEDPVLQDPYVFGPPGSGSIIQRFGSGIRILQFTHKGVEWTEKECLQNKIVTQNFSKI
jgi:hypothetical protein